VSDAVQSETLLDRVNRMKHRWLKRVMSDPGVSPSEKCFAYIVMDRLNCVTRDSWPGQPLIAQQLGRRSIKTVSRIAFGLESRGYQRVNRNTHGSLRYAPVFLPEDEDKPVPTSRQNCPSVPDKNVEESSLDILISKSSPSLGERGKCSRGFASKYERRKRGSYEAEVAALLGNGGYEILMRLSGLDDAIVERLCRAFADGELGARELIAARLAAEQLSRKRRQI
jgi:hypothetical protein